LRAAHGFNHQRTDHEWADTHNFDHVEGNGFLQAEAAFEARLGWAEVLTCRRRGHALRG
jgi:hypothetical protein